MQTGIGDLKARVTGTSSRKKKYKRSSHHTKNFSKKSERGLNREFAGLSRLKVSPVELTAQLCSQSFYDFVVQFWDTIVPETFVDNWHIKYLCEELQEIAERVFRGEPKKHDLIINISPGETKSTLVDIMLPAWIWTRMPNAGIIGASNTHALAVEMSRKNRAVVRSGKYAECWPHIKVALDQDAKGFFVNTKGGARISAGVEGDIIGRHGDFIIIDDPLDPKGGRSELDVKNANIFIRETLWSRKKNKAVTPMILIMQRLCENDPTGMMLKEWTNVKHICLPAEVSENVKPAELKEFYQDGLMNPKKHPRSVLAEAAIKGEYFFAGQYCQSPIPLGGAMFHVDRLIIERTPPRKWKMRMRYWDKAGTKDAGMYSVGALLGKDFEDRFWVLDVVRGQWDTNARERTIRQTAEMDGRAVYIAVEQEPGSGGKESAENTVRNLAGFRVRMDRPTGDKAQRADPFSGQVNASNVYLVKAAWNHDYIEELRFFSMENSKYKDQVDASSGAFKFVSKPVFRAGGWKL
jgi:predicted phage terminase large subunit-like protein